MKFGKHILFALTAFLFVTMPSFALEGDSEKQLNDRTWWYGNTFRGGKGADAHWVQLEINDLAISGDKIYTICNWDERGGEATIYTTGGEHVMALPGWHSWGRHGGQAVAADDQYAYFSMGHNPGDGGGVDYAGVARYTLDGKMAGFPGARRGCHLVVNNDNRQTPTGLAVYGGELFVSDPTADMIRVYNTADMSHIRDFDFKNPGRIAVDAGDDHDLWVVDRVENVVRKITRSGKPRGVSIIDCKKPAALCVDIEGNVLVADSAIDRQQINTYTADGKHIDGVDFGSPIYMGENPGAVQPGKFYRITGIRTDRDGNLYVSTWGYSAKLYKFDKERKQVWVLKGMEFVSCGDADPADDTSVYSPGHRYLLDYDAAPGESWAEKAITLDPLTYPNDPRTRNAWMSMQMYRLQGKKIMMGKQQMAPNMYYWRFDGEIAVPAAMYFPYGVRMNGQAAQQFSARWTGFVQAPESGEYTFTTVSDDGIRLWVNGRQLIDNWTGHGPTPDSGTIELEAGKRYPIKVEYFQGGGPCSLQLYWQQPGKKRTILKDALFTTADGDQKGLAAGFFRGTNLQDLAQERTDAAVNYPLFAGEIDKPSFGVPEYEGYPPHRPLGPFIWSDTNGDGDMQADEYIDVPNGSQALMTDADGNIWVNTGGWQAGKGQITKIPFAGLNKFGAPTWDVDAATSTTIPADTGIQYLSKLHYDAKNDRMYIAAWTDEHPYPGGGWEQMNTAAAVQRFDNWSADPKFAWEQDIRVKDLRSKAPDRTAHAKSWSFAGDYLFVGYVRNFDQIAVDVYRTSDGVRMGMLLPTADIGYATGWTDMNESIQTHLRDDGTYVVFVEEVWMQKNLYYLWKPTP